MSPREVKFICPECEGRGKVLDAPQDVLGGRTYLDNCSVCQGSGWVILVFEDEQ
jgi:DnaJ-class molecular chaperone